MTLMHLEPKAALVIHSFEPHAQYLTRIQTSGGFCALAVRAGHAHHEVMSSAEDLAPSW